MSHQRIKVRGHRKAEPNLGLYVLALIELARQLQAADEQRAAQQAGDAATDEEVAGD